MRFPVHMMTDNIQHQVRNAIQGNKRYPFVLMLEPLYTCNLACIGCAIERHTGKLKDRLSLEKCIEAVEITKAPVVSICGGEPTIYPELPELVEAIIQRKRQIILCTNGLLLDENLYGTIPPNKRLTINVHLDGMKATHDYVCARDGVFDKAIAMIEKGRILATGTVQEVLERVRQRRILSVRLAGAHEGLERFLLEQPGVLNVHEISGRMQFEFGGGDDEQVALVGRLVGAGFPLLEFSARSAGLEDLFIEITERGVQ